LVQHITYVFKIYISPSRVALFIGFEPKNKPATALVNNQSKYPVPGKGSCIKTKN